MKTDKTMAIIDLDWMVGDWHGKIGVDTVEEHWTRARGGTMMGMFRWVNGDHVKFYEFMLIETQGDGTVILRIKHFNSGLEGWEEKDVSQDFPLQRANGTEALFGGSDGKGLVYHRAANTLSVSADMADGSTLKLSFNRREADPDKDIERSG